MKKHVAVLKGGWSSERDVSLTSGTECAKALRKVGYAVTEIDLRRDLGGLLAALDPAPAVVFNALHGRYGEDGHIQAILNILDIPYTHSGLLASAIAMDKARSKEVFKAAGDAVARARKGGGATLIEVKTDRYLGHFQGDAEVYRPKDEVGELRKSDPIPSLGGVLRARGMLDDAKDKAIRDRVHASVTKAFDFARQSPYPAPREALEHVFA